MDVNMKIYSAFLMRQVERYVEKLPPAIKAGIWADITAIEHGDFQSAYTKKLKGQIRELIVKDFRLLFFISRHTIYFTSIFRKQSAKTPRQEIERAERLYKENQQQ